MLYKREKLEFEKYENQTHGEIYYKKLKYARVLWLGGFVKTTLSSALIGAGTVLFINGLSNTPTMLFADHEFQELIGLTSIVAGIIIVFIIDKYREKYKKKELNFIHEEIHIEANKIANEKIMEAMKNIRENSANKGD